MTIRGQVVAVVVHYGDLKRTTRAILGHWKLRIFSRIIVVANDLSERPAELTDDICTWVIPSRNLGFGGGCQFATTTCSADVYAFFNAHITMDGDSIHRCIEAFDIPNVGIVAPCVYLQTTNNPEINWKYAHCIRTYTRIMRRPVRVPLRQPKQHDTVLSDARTRENQSNSEVIDNDWVTGCAIFCRSEIIRNIGWDGSYFLMYEDADITMRAKRCDWRVVTVPSAIAYHSGDSTTPNGMSPYYGARNLIWFSRKYWNRTSQILLTLYVILLLFRITIADVLRRRRPRHAPSAVRGIVDGWTLWPTGKDPLPGEPLRFHPQK